MKGIEPILYKGEKVACVYRKDIVVSDIKFLTTPDNLFQIGIHDRKDQVQLPAHTHNVPSPITINQIQEVLFVMKGKIRVTMLTETSAVISKKLLIAGDAILLISQAHQVEFLGNTRVFEIKQGPYPGDGHAKHFLT